MTDQKTRTLMFRNHASGEIAVDDPSLQLHQSSKWEPVVVIPRGEYDQVTDKLDKIACEAEEMFGLLAPLVGRLRSRRQPDEMDVFKPLMRALADYRSEMARAKSSAIGLGAGVAILAGAALERAVETAIAEGTKQ